MSAAVPFCEACRTWYQLTHAGAILRYQCPTCRNICIRTSKTR